MPVPAHALVELLRGQAPVLKHASGAATIAWDRHGYYVVDIPSTRDATEEIHIAPHPADFALPWDSQRMRLVDVVVKQYGGVRYHATLGEHAPAPMAGPRVDPDFPTEPAVPPSGPECHAELPRTIHVEVPEEDADVLFRYGDVTWNPPIVDGTFTQPVPAGMEPFPVECRDE